jgi:hypothetical protein
MLRFPVRIEQNGVRFRLFHARYGDHETLHDQKIEQIGDLLNYELDTLLDAVSK